MLLYFLNVPIKTLPLDFVNLIHVFNAQWDQLVGNVNITNIQWEEFGCVGNMGFFRCVYDENSQVVKFQITFIVSELKFVADSQCCWQILRHSNEVVKLRQERAYVSLKFHISGVPQTIKDRVDSFFKRKTLARNFHQPYATFAIPEENRTCLWILSRMRTQFPTLISQSREQLAYCTYQQ